MSTLVLFIFVGLAPVPVDPPPSALLVDSLYRPGRQDKDRIKYLREQEAICKSEAVFRAALARPEVAALGCVKEQADALAWLKANLVVEADENVATIRITLRTGARSEQARIVDGIVTAYLAEGIRLRNHRYENDLRSAIAHRTRLLKELPNFLKEEAKATTPEDKELWKLLRENCERSIKGADGNIEYQRRMINLPFRMHVQKKPSP